MKPSSNIWIQRQQCPCGGWNCYIKYEGEDQTSVNSEQLKNERLPTYSSSDAVFTPYVSQIFRTDTDAFEYYSSFARKNGFSIRKARSTESQNLGIYRRDFVCYRSGFNQPRKKANVEHHRERKSVRCGCDAKLYLTKEIVDGAIQWYVSQFSNVHNHELLQDDQVRLLPAYRKIQESDQERILLMSKAGFPVNRIVKVLELEKGVQPGQLPFLEKDVRNFVRSCKKTIQENVVLLTEKQETDMVELIEACKAMVQKDAEFSYDYTTDENDKVENITWSYGDSIRAYSVFGDVVHFDYTYWSMTHGMLLGLWFGIDNHGNTILFGCALLQDESSNSFAWALQTFIRFMKGRHPQTIVTDMDIGVRDAISRELSGTKHVISIWHVLSKISTWFSSVLGSQYMDFKAEFEMLSQLESIEEFEHRWDLLIARFGLASDKHIALLFSYRGFWPLAYTRNCFLGRTLAAEFSQSLGLFMKRVITAHTCLQVFFEQAGVAAKPTKVANGELLYAQIKTCMPIEEHARSVLTPYAFNLLQNEIVLSMQYMTTELGNGSFIIRHYKKMDDGEYLVTWIPDDDHVHCSCKEFAHSGILCRHSLRVLAVKNYFEIPEKYFLYRWKLESSLVDNGVEVTDQRSSDDYIQAFHFLTANLWTESLVSEERFSYVHTELTSILDHVKHMPSYS